MTTIDLLLDKISDLELEHDDRSLTPYEVAKAYREVVEKYAFENKVRSVTMTYKEKEFEMAVNKLAEKVLKEKLKQSAKSLDKPELF